MDLKDISYEDIISIFDNTKWDFSYLTYSEMEEVLNFPVKISINHLERLIQKPDLESDVIFLIIVKQTDNYDYSLGNEFEEICHKYIPDLSFSSFWCNYKYAAVKSGLGQYAKNSLFYHPKFQFETHLHVVVLFNHINDLPNRQQNNFNYLSLCENCSDCYNACPVSAIHNQDNFPWIDMKKCDNFCFFGNHDYIPSIKQNHILLRNVPKDKKNKITSYEQFNKEFPNISLSAGIMDDNGKVYWGQYPTCRECTSQPKCSKYNGKYPYHEQKVIIKSINEEI